MQFQIILNVLSKILSSEQINLCLCLGEFLALLIFTDVKKEKAL